ncbi:MAG: flagellar biosynthesis protein FlhA [Planctomycetaceae bacterium]|nr:MAG: flagellar biosynthesis protein FlhA [Planctomycetaceae bacterium]
MAYLVRWQGLFLPVGIIVCVLVMIVPLPASLLDLLLAANIAGAVIILLTALHVRTPLEFSLFPTLLLTATLSRLVLNVASTRLILTKAPQDGHDAAGQVIRAFGEFVTGNHALIGLVIFLIIVVIQFVVITKGAARISEVAARFALDGMPGRQMAIDADLNAGLIDEHEAQRRRLELTEQADFYGAMDGAGKFVRGDAIAGVMITAINLVGGLLLGVFEAKMGLLEAGSVFSRLTIGDGLVSQIPALLISLAAGLLVTRSSRSIDLPREFLRQLFGNPQVLAVAAAFLGLLVFTQLPTLPLLAIGGGCAGLAWLLSRSSARREAEAADQAALAATESSKEPAGGQKRIEDFLAVDPVELEIGAGLIRLADPQRNGDLLAQITEVRRRVASELGIVLPKVRIRDNLTLGRRAYRILLLGTPVAEGSVYPDRWLAVAQNASEADAFSGPRQTDPFSGRAGIWVDIDQLPGVREAGCRLVEPSRVMAGHLRQVVRRHAADLLTRDATKHLIDELYKTSPAVVDELIPDVLRLGEVQQVLQRLLREHVAIRQLQTILEALSDLGPRTRDPVRLTEFVRQRLSRALCTCYRDSQRRLRVATIDPAVERQIADSIVSDGEGLRIHLAPSIVQSICQSIRQGTLPLQSSGYPAVVLVSAEIRAALKQLTMAHLPQLIVLSYEEISSDTIVESVRLVVGETLAVAA